MLARLDDSEAAAKILASLAERYALTPADAGTPLVHVLVDDAQYTDQAVARPASVLENIDRDWETRLGLAPFRET